MGSSRVGGSGGETNQQHSEQEKGSIRGFRIETTAVATMGEVSNFGLSHTHCRHT